MQQQQTGLNNPSNNNEISNQFITDSINGFISSYKKLQALTNNTLQSNTKEKDAQNDALQSNAKEKGATNEELQSNAKETGTSNEGLQSNTEEIRTSNSVIYSNAKETFDINKVNLSIFPTKLRHIMSNCNNDTIITASKVLISLHKNPHQTQRELMKVSGLSLGGLSKHIGMLRKRGLIVRVKFQHHELSSSTSQMLRDSCIL